MRVTVAGSRNRHKAANYKKLYKTWRNDIVSVYSVTRLAYLMDRLPCLSGFIAEFSSKINIEYLASLRKGDILASLCWNATQPFERPTEYIAPSRSWASLLSAVQFADARIVFGGISSRHG